MKVRDLYSFQRGLNNTRFNHPTITYAINKNKRLVAEALRDVDKTKEPSEEYKKYLFEKEVLADRFSVKDSSGKPVLYDIKEPLTGKVQKAYDIKGMHDEKSEYRVELKKLEGRFKKEIDEHNEKIRKFNEEFLDTEIGFAPYMITLELLAQHERCPQDVMDLIFWMIKTEQNDTI